jgi:plasmid stability protein
MSTTLTIRTSETLRRKLEEQAAERGTSLSEVVREILENGVTPRSLEERAGHLRGKLALPRQEVDPWRRSLRERNWRQ